MVDQILELPEGARFSVLAPVVREKKGEFVELLAKLRQDGFVRANVDGELTELADPPKLDKGKTHTIEVFVDRLVKKDGIRQRLTDSVELAAKLAEGVVKVSPLEGDDLLFSEKFACTTCGISYPEITPRLFSFNNPAGACPACDGIGAKMYFDPDLIVPDEELSIARGGHRAVGAAQQRLLPPDPRRGLQPASRSISTSPGTSCPQRRGRSSSTARRARRSSSRFEKNGRKHSYRREFEGVLANLRRRFEEYERRRREQGRTSEEDFEAIYDEFHRYMSQTDLRGVRAAPGCARRRASSRWAARASPR